MPVSEVVLAEIRKRFAADQVEAVAGLLSQYGTDRMETGAERIHLDILKLCKGKLAKVAGLVKCAKRDYRDVITWAEYGHMMTYPVAFMRKGPNWSAQPAAKMLFAHSQFMLKLKESGKLIVGGPFLDNGEPLWMYIFDVEAVSDAESLVAADPAVEAGHFRFEFRPWFGPFGLRVNFKEAMDAESK